MNDPDGRIDDPQPAPTETGPDGPSPSERLEELLHKMAAFQEEMQDLYARISLIELPPEDEPEAEAARKTGD